MQPVAKGWDVNIYHELIEVAAMLLRGDMQREMAAILEKRGLSEGLNQAVIASVAEEHRKLAVRLRCVADHYRASVTTASANSLTRDS